VRQLAAAAQQLAEAAALAQESVQQRVLAEPE
jgi:hypothetical protein